jgi:hypothetical protein
MTQRTIDGHADFINCPDKNRYVGALHGLFVFLSFESKKQPETWYYRVLRSGAMVAMRRKPNGMRIMRISRSESFKTPEGPEKWNAELKTFLEHFKEPILWTRVDDDTASGVGVFFHEEAPGPRCKQCRTLLDPNAIAAMSELCESCALKAKQIPAGWEKCHEADCDNIIEKNPAFRVNRCQPCAMRAGRAHADSMRNTS